MIWPFTSRKTPAELLEQLRTGTLADRQSALGLLADHEDPETDDLLLTALRTMPEGPPEQLLPIIELVGRRGIEDGVEVLRPFLTDEDDQVKLAAVRALGRIPTQASLDAIIPLLIDEDLTIRREIRETILRVFGEKAQGALIRAVPEDQESPLYFEIVSLCEELGVFEQMIESFEDPDEDLRKFQFNNMVRFHRPEFVRCFFIMADTSAQAIQNRLRKTLADYSTEEMVEPVRELFAQREPTKPQLKLLEDVLFNRSDAREALLKLGSELPKREMRLDLIGKILKKGDTLLFKPALDLIGDPYPSVRQLVADSLGELVVQTLHRIADPRETNASFLQEQVRSWQEEVQSRIAEETNPEVLGMLTRVLFALAAASPQIVVPAMNRLMSEVPAEVFKPLPQWNPEARVELFSSAVRHDRQVGGLLVRGLLRFPQNDLLRSLLEIYGDLSGEDRELLRKGLTGRSSSLKVNDLLLDPSAHVRMAILSLLADTPGDLNGILEDRFKDTDAGVREFALALIIGRRHPKLVQLLESALSDPAPGVVMKALTGLKETSTGDRFPPALSRVIHHPSDEVRTFALREIAKITQAKYLENFRNLPPQVRKLAGRAILKLDSGFLDQLINELRSLDVDTRLRAALIMENLSAGEKVHSALLAAMKDPSQKVRAAVVKTLGVIGNQSLLGHLLSFLNDPDERVRANTIEAITAFGNEQALRILLPFLDDRNNRIRANAVLAVYRIGRVNVLPVVMKMLNSKDPGMKASALWVLGEIKLEAHIGLIIPHFRDRNDMVRFNAMRSASKIKPELLKPLLPQLRRDPSPDIKRLVIELSSKII